AAIPARHEKPIILARQHVLRLHFDIEVVAPGALMPTVDQADLWGNDARNRTFGGKRLLGFGHILFVEAVRHQDSDRPAAKTLVVFHEFFSRSCCLSPPSRGERATRRRTTCCGGKASAPREPSPGRVKPQSAGSPADARLKIEPRRSAFKGRRQPLCRTCEKVSAPSWPDAGAAR